MAAKDVAPKGSILQFPKFEVWKPVPSEPGMLASSWGRVLLPPRHAPMRNGGFRLYTPGPTYGSETRASKNATHVYRGIMVKSVGDGKPRPRKVHQLICEAFHGIKPFASAVVIHLDECSLNNRPENLRWGTQKENLNMPGFLKYCRGRVGENNPISKSRNKPKE